MAEASPAKQWERFLARFDPPIVKLIKASVLRMRGLVPGAIELVYDNFNALVIGFGPSERASEAVFSIAVYPKWANLFFLQGAKLKDPRRLLKGSGTKVRHIRLVDVRLLDTPDVRALIEQARDRASTPIDPNAKRRMVIRAVAAKQRPRR